MTMNSDLPPPPTQSDNHENRPPLQGIVFAYKGTKEALMGMVEPALHSLKSLPKPLHLVPGISVTTPPVLAIFALNLAHNKDNHNRLSEATSHTLVAVGTELGELSLLSKAAKLPKNIVAIGLLASEVAECCEPYLWQITKERESQLLSGECKLITDSYQPVGPYDAAALCSILAVPSKVGHAIEKCVIELSEKLSVSVADALFATEPSQPQKVTFPQEYSPPSLTHEPIRSRFKLSLYSPPAPSDTASFETLFKASLVPNDSSENQDRVTQQFEQFASEALLRTQLGTGATDSLNFTPVKSTLQQALEDMHSSVAQVDKLGDVFALSSRPKQLDVSTPAPILTSFDSFLKELHDRRIAGTPFYESCISKIASIAHQPYPSLSYMPGESFQSEVLRHLSVPSHVHLPTQATPIIPPYNQTTSPGQRFFRAEVEATNKVYSDFQATVSEMKQRLS